MGEFLEGCGEREHECMVWGLVQKLIIVAERREEMTECRESRHYTTHNRRQRSEGREQRAESRENESACRLRSLFTSPAPRRLSTPAADFLHPQAHQFFFGVRGIMSGERSEPRLFLSFRSG
jgi:hypothetical protein